MNDNNFLKRVNDKSMRSIKGKKDILKKGFFLSCSDWLLFLTNLSHSFHNCFHHSLAYLIFKQVNI